MKSKLRKIEKVVHGPFSIDIRMDDQGVFHCEYGSQEMDGTLPECRLWARELLRNMGRVNWQPIMRVVFDSEDTRVNNLKNASNISCYIERFWIAWDGKHWVQSPWVVDAPGTWMCSGPNNSERKQDEMPEDQLMAQRLARSIRFYDAPDVLNLEWPLIVEGLGDHQYYVQYTEENWQTMLGILERIRELRDGINQLLATQKGWTTLGVIANRKLLAAPESKKKDK